MMGFNHCRVLSLCLLGGLVLVGCTRHPYSTVSTAHEIERVTKRTLPNNGALHRVSEPVRNEFSVRATWEIQTNSDGQTYFQWVKKQLEPDYHVVAETSSSVTFMKDNEGDSYAITIESRSAPAGVVVEAQFVATPD
jgi:hypothetical protein